MALANEVEALLVQFGSSGGKLQIARVDALSSPCALALSWPELNAILPDGGLPRGVVELTAPQALGGSTSVALAAVRAGQARSKDAWCAWLDPESTLHAPGVVAMGVELSRMLVIRVPRAQIGRVAAKVVASGAFEVVVIDYDAVPLAEAGGSVLAGRLPEGVAALSPGRRRTSTSAERSPKGPLNSVPRRRGVEASPNNAPLLIRKLALAAEPSGTTVLLLTNASRPRTMQWPVALRVELSRPGPGDLTVRIAKDKRGRIGLAKTIPFRSKFQALV